MIKIEFRDREFRFWLCGWYVLKNTHVLKDTNVKMNVLLLRKGCPGRSVHNFVAGCTQRVIKGIEIANGTSILELRATKQFINEMMGLTNWTRVKKFQKRTFPNVPIENQSNLFEI